MTTILHVTFEDDAEAGHFASMLKADRGVVYKPHHATPDIDEAQSIKDVRLERKPECRK